MFSFARDRKYQQKLFSSCVNVRNKSCNFTSGFCSIDVKESKYNESTLAFTVKLY